MAETTEAEEIQSEMEEGPPIRREAHLHHYQGWEVTVSTLRTIERNVHPQLRTTQQQLPLPLSLLQSPSFDAMMAHSLLPAQSVSLHDCLPAAPAMPQRSPFRAEYQRTQQLPRPTFGRGEYVTPAAAGAAAASGILGSLATPPPWRTGQSAVNARGSSTAHLAEAEVELAAEEEEEAETTREAEEVAEESLADEHQMPVPPDSDLWRLPSEGSALHAEGRCKPCVFLHTKGCENGITCPFCHLCGPGEKKLRRKLRYKLNQHQNHQMIGR